MNSEKERRSSKINVEKNKHMSFDDSFLEKVSVSIMKSDSLLNKIIDKVMELFNNKLHAAIDRINDKVDKHFNKLHEEISAMKVVVTTQENEIAHLKNKLVNIEQSNENMNLRVYSVNDVNSVDIMNELEVKVFSKLPLKINKPIEAFRIGKLQSGKNRPIFIRFGNGNDRKLVFNNKKYLKNTGITIKEDLTFARLSLLKHLNDKFGFKNVWSVNGTIFARHNGRISKFTRKEDLV